MKTTEEEKLLKEFNEQWKALWRDLVGDKIHAEKIAPRDFSLLFIDRGTVVSATKEAKPPNYKDLLKRHRQTIGVEAPPDPTVGGWRKFSRTQLKNTKNPDKPEEHHKPKRKHAQHLKKGGRGWLNAEL